MEVVELQIRLRGDEVGRWIIDQDLNLLCVQFAVACEPVFGATLTISLARVMLKESTSL
jgi:hypothetical protein